MDRIQKALQKLSDKEREMVKKVLTSFQAHRTQGLDIAKLKGYSDVYRIRKGNVRIIFQMKDGALYLLKIDRRSDTTYNEF